MINSNGNVTMWTLLLSDLPICFESPSGFNNFEVHGQYSCPIQYTESAWWTLLLSDLPICFESPSGFNNFEVHGQYSCPICFEAPSVVDNREVHAHYCCPICFEAPSGFDILRYFTIFPVSCVQFLIHFRFRENFRYFCNFS
jgi:hypothetical protein